MVNLLRKYDRTLIFAAPLLLAAGVIAKLIFGIAPVAHLDELGSFMSGLVPQWLNYVLAGVLAIMASVMVNQSAQNLGLLGRISNFAMFFFILLFFGVPSDEMPFYAWILVFLQLALIRWLVVMPEELTKLRLHMFNTGFVVGIMMLLAPWSVLFLILAFVAVQYAASLSARLILIGLIGLLLPFYLLNAVLYIAAAPLYFPEFEVQFLLLQPPFSFDDAKAFVLALSIMLIAAIAALTAEGSSTLREKRRWLLTLYTLAISMVLVLNGGWSYQTLLLPVPGSIIFARAFLSMRNAKLSTLLFVCLLAVIFFINSAQ